MNGTNERKPSWGILGVTESPRPPLVAKAKIGRMEETNGIARPQRLDYIIFVEPKTGRELEEYAVLGDHPQEFLAVLPADLVEHFVEAGWKRYGTKGIKCYGDGVTGFDKENGEILQCAGPYLKDNPERHECPFARPTKDGRGKYKQPECKPVLSLRLLVPQVGEMGVVQIDTGGVSSSVPNLTWQLRAMERRTNGHLAGVAIMVGMRPFPDKFGNTAWSWTLRPASAEEAASIRYEALERIDGQTLPQEVLDAPQVDIYGLEMPVAELPEGTVLEGNTPNTTAQFPEESERAKELESELLNLAVPTSTPAKQRTLVATIAENRRKAQEFGTWLEYLDWLTEKIDQLKGKDEPQQGAMI